MNITLNIGQDEIHRLTKMVIKDTDTADKQALEYLLWQIAEKAGVCDSEGNLAAPVTNSINVKGAYTLPDGVYLVELDCADQDALKKLPAAINYEGKQYGRTGWNSDANVAYYRTDKKVAYC